MAKVIVMYPEPLDKQGFKDHYEEVHLPLVNHVEGVENVVIHSVSESENTKQDVYQLVEIEFENEDIMQKSLASEQWKKVESDLENVKTLLTGALGRMITR